MEQADDIFWLCELPMGDWATKDRTKKCHKKWLSVKQLYYLPGAASKKHWRCGPDLSTHSGSWFQGAEIAPETDQ